MFQQSETELEESIKNYHQALRDNGFQIDDKKVTLMLHTYLDSNKDEAKEICEKPFKNYLRSVMGLLDTKKEELGIESNIESLINMSYKKYNDSNTLIGTPESCQKLLHQVEAVGVTEVACFIDFGIENKKVLSGIEKIVEARNLFNLTKLYQSA